MTEFDFAFLTGRLIAAAVMLPLSIAFMLLTIGAFALVFGIGRDNSAKVRGLRASFDRIELDAKALAIFLGAVVIAAAMLAGKLVG